MCPIPHTSAYRSKSKLLETDGDRRTMLRMGLVHTQDNSQGVSGIEPECTARYRDLLYAQTWIECHRSQGLMAHPTGRGVGVPAHPTETLGGLQVESKYVAVRHFKTIINMETISVLISFPHPGVSYSIITYCPVTMSTGCP